MTALFWLVAAFACLVFALIIIHELKKAPYMNSPFEDIYERHNSINRQLRDRSAVRFLRFQKFKKNEQ